MNEIEQMYRNAGIKMEGENFINPFTAEKQLTLLIGVLANREVRINPKWLCSGYYLGDFSKPICSMNIKGEFAILLAQHINAIWQDLTEDEKQKIREILKQ